jgi:tRNA(fMet)-specific endonuclease VapC
MVTHLLDTNVCVEILRGRGEKIVSRCVSHPPGSLVISAVSLGELAFGASLSTKENEAVRVATLVGDFQMIPFEDAAAWEYGKIRHELKKTGCPMGGLDLMIAATARANGWTVVTNNTGEFSRIRGLRLEDWQH